MKRGHTVSIQLRKNRSSVRPSPPTPCPRLLCSISSLCCFSLRAGGGGLAPKTGSEPQPKQSSSFSVSLAGWWATRGSLAPSRCFSLMKSRGRRQRTQRAQTGPSNRGRTGSLVEGEQMIPLARPEICKEPGLAPAAGEGSASHPSASQCDPTRDPLVLGHRWKEQKLCTPQTRKPMFQAL